MRYFEAQAWVEEPITNEILEIWIKQRVEIKYKDVAALLKQTRLKLIQDRDFRPFMEQ